MFSAATFTMIKKRYPKPKTLADDIDETENRSVRLGRAMSLGMNGIRMNDVIDEALGIQAAPWSEYDVEVDWGDDDPATAGDLARSTTPLLAKEATE